jgi:Cu+-exporting ATPase
MTMKEETPVTKDPVCGMTVDPATALHAERDGKTFHFCSGHCRAKFLSRHGRYRTGGQIWRLL